MTRQITLRLSDDHSGMLDRLSHGGRTANEVLRSALVAYDAICRDAATMRARGETEGLIQIETQINGGRFTFRHRGPIV